MVDQMPSGATAIRVSSDQFEVGPRAANPLNPGGRYLDRFSVREALA
jgi:hypothetical protein